MRAPRETEVQLDSPSWTVVGSVSLERYVESSWHDLGESRKLGDGFSW